MSNEELTALAREYAEEINPVNQLNDYPEAKMIADMMRNALSEVIDEQIKDFEGFLRFLLRRFYLVEKEAVRKQFESAKRLIEARNYNKQCIGVGSRGVLERLFPDLGKEVEG